MRNAPQLMFKKTANDKIISQSAESLRLSVENYNIL